MAIVKPDILHELVNRLAREFTPERIWLFGSHAWGEAKAGSDFDLLVVVPESVETPARRVQRAQQCVRDLPVATDILVRTREEFDMLRQIPASLESAIVQCGNSVYG